VALAKVLIVYDDYHYEDDYGGEDDDDNNIYNFISPNIMYACLWCCHHGRAIARVYSVHLMNVERSQAAADPQTKPNDSGCESACRLPASTFTISIYSYYSARKLILILSSHGGWKAEST